MSVRGDHIRQKFRQEIRSRQIAQMMKIQRERALNQCKQASIFQTLNKKIKDSANQKLHMQLVNELTSLLDSHPSEENTYVLIGNFLLTHPNSHPYFAYKVLGMSEIAGKLQSYGWAFIVMLTRSQQLSSQLMAEYDSALSNILSSSHPDSLASNLSLFHILLTFTPSKNQLPCTSKFYLKCTIDYFLNFLQKTDPKKQANDVQYLIVAITHIICQHYMENMVFKEHVPALMRVLVVGISDYCVYRGQFIGLMSRIGALWLQQFEQVFQKQFGITVINQLFYMYENTIKQRIQILQIFQLFIQQFSYNKLLFLLNKGLHLTLLQTFQTRPQTPQHISKALQLLLMLLTKIKQKQDSVVLHKLMDSLQENKFQIYLEDLLAERQQEIVEKYLIQIVDEFYAEEIE